MRQVILASQSPRRKDLLAHMGVPFSVVPSDYDERLDDARSPASVAQELGLGKALTVAEQYPEAVVIGSDVIVSVEGKQYGKPKDAAEARAMLRAESGRCNLVTASVAVVCGAEKFQEVSSLETKIYLKPYNDQAIETYMKTGDWHDKAGAYGVQSGAAPLIDCIEGRYDVILGIPTNILVTLLKRLGIEAHEATITPPRDLVFK